MDHSSFGKLPPELRNEVYTYLSFPPRRLIAVRASSSDWYQHPISRTCRLLRADTQHLNYRDIQINTLDPHRRQHPRPLLEAIGPLACSNLRSIGDCFERADLFDARMAKWRGECEAKGISLTTEEVEYSSVTFRGAAKVISETYDILREMGIVLKTWKSLFKGVPMVPTVTFEPLKSGSVSTGHYGTASFPLPLFRSIRGIYHDWTFTRSLPPTRPPQSCECVFSITNMDDSFLSKLPPELRNRIYDLSIPENYAVHIGSPELEGNILHPITRTCRQMRAETLSLVLSKLTVYLFRPTDAELLASWIRHMGPSKCKYLRRISHFFHAEEMQEKLRALRAAYRLSTSEEVVLKECSRRLSASRFNHGPAVGRESVPCTVTADGV